MRCWRICRARWSAQAWDGEGARLLGGRWNHPGDRMVYAAGSLSLAALETLVHVEPEIAPADLVAIPAELPDDLEIERWSASDLPRDWRSYPAPAQLRDLGADWLRSRRTAVLLVPCAVIPEESCLLINPAHPRAAALRPGDARPFSFDPRLFGA
ncbi:RES family NAD+ phosphorylase [Vulgatibacter sp.]|uniref:RES family NAD+ phosphorylase n=1 Tax=Vulgatibacter sp. TaxID=1971226 RepID=UPI0035648E33